MFGSTVQALPKLLKNCGRRAVGYLCYFNKKMNKKYFPLPILQGGKSDISHLQLIKKSHFFHFVNLFSVRAADRFKKLTFIILSSLNVWFIVGAQIPADNYENKEKSAVNRLPSPTRQ